MHKTTRPCTSLLRVATRTLLTPPTSFTLLKTVPVLFTCRHYSTNNKATLPKEAVAFLETLREQYKPHEDKISMEQAETNMHNWAKEGHEYLNEEKYDRALKCFDKVINVELPEGYAKTVEMREHTASAYIGRAFIYVRTEKNQEANSDYEYLLDNFDDNPDVIVNTYHDRAVMKYQLGDCEGALEDINKCLDGPLRKTEFGQANLHDMYQLRAHIYADLNKEDEAIADANWLLSKKKTIEHYMFRSNLYHEFGKVEEAKKDIDVADEMGADDSQFWFSRSLIYIQVPGGEVEATKSLKKAFRRDPGLEREIDEFPALKPIYESILKSRGTHPSQLPPPPPPPS